MRRSLPPLLCHDLGRRVFSGLARVLRPWAYLRLGGVESVAGKSVAFRLPNGEGGFPVSPDKRETRCQRSIQLSYGCLRAGPGKKQPAEAGAR